MSKVSVLVVEDSPFMATAIARLLSTDPEFSVVGIASSASQALAVTEESAPFDVATVDLELADGGGFSLIGDLTRAGKGVVVVSGDFELHDQARSMGATACLGKAGLLDRRYQLIENVRTAARTRSGKRRNFLRPMQSALQ